MARLEPVGELPTIWTTPDDLWQEFILPLLREHDPEPRTGRPRIDQRKALDGIIYLNRTGCQWNALPAEFGNDSSVHRTYQRWVRLGLFEKLWAALVEYARRLGLVDWDWQSSDTSMGKARFRGPTAAPTPRIVRNPAPNAGC
jgi:putative transposase